MQKTKEIRTNQGITLIALVITIVVIIILAGVAIYLSLTNNGIFTRAKQARDLNNKAEATEKMNTKITNAQLEKYAEKQQMPTLQELADKLYEDDEIEYVALETKVATKEKITVGENSSIYTKLTQYSYEFEINGKLQIVKIDRTKVTNSNNSTEGGGQTPTDPVEVKPGESGYAGGKYNDPYIPIGFKHKEGTWNTGYTIIGETKSIGNEFVWVPCVLTAEEQQVAQSNRDTVQIFQKTTTGKYNEYGLKLLPTNSNVEIEDSSVQALEESVGTYGGFYISKYEAGIPGTSESVTTNHNTSTTGDILPVSQPNVGVWNFISRTDAIAVSKAMIDHEQTGMYSTLISGAAWDTTLQWITNTIDAEYAENSRDKGNYSGEVAITASNTAYSKNNIYDMAGNVNEWTTENCIFVSDPFPVRRGRLLQGCW